MLLERLEDAFRPRGNFSNDEYRGVERAVSAKYIGHTAPLSPSQLPGEGNPLTDAQRQTIVEKCEQAPKMSQLVKDVQEEQQRWKRRAMVGIDDQIEKEHYNRDYTVNQDHLVSRACDNFKPRCKPCMAERQQRVNALFGILLNGRDKKISELNNVREAKRAEKREKTLREIRENRQRMAEREQ